MTSRFDYRIDQNEFLLFLTEPDSEIDYTSADQILHFARTALESGFSSMTFDMANLKFIDSYGLGSMIKASKLIHFSVRNANRNLMKLMKMTGVVRNFHF